MRQHIIRVYASVPLFAIFLTATFALVILGLGLALVPHSASAYALKGKVYVSLTGSDSTCVVNQSSLPCKTITHAAAIAGNGGSASAWDVVIADGTYHENVVIANSGNASAPLRILPVAGAKVYIDGTGMGPVGLEVTGNYVYMVGPYVQNFSGDCIYAHGTDADHPQINLHLNLMGQLKCGGYVVHTEFTNLFDDGYGRIFDTHANAVMYIHNSPMFHIHDQNIYQDIGYPSVIGALIVNSPNGNFEGVNGKISGLLVTLDAENSPFMNIVNNNPPPPLSNTFTCTINPPSDRATDTIANNGSGCLP